MKIKTIIVVLLVVVMAAALCACNGGEDAVYAQSLRSLNDMGPVGVADRFAGMAVSGQTKEIKKDPSLTVEEIKVEEGQLVKAGDVLFTYNNESANLNVEEAKLEIETLKNKITTLNSQISELTKERNSAASSDKLAYTLEIQGLQADVKETQYTLGVKEKALKALEKTAGDTQVKSEIDGRVTEINENGGTTEDGNEKPFITIVEVGNLRVKGTINEMNRGALNEGDPVTIRSRTDETQTWQGVIQTIDWENAEKEDRSNYGFYGGESDEMTTSSKYPFYITVEDPEGLIVGQHVYIEPGETVSNWSDQLMIPAYFVNDADDAPWVWAVNGRDRLEKREITLGDYDETTEQYAVLTGLTLDDYVAFPDETLQPGMKAEKIDGYAPADDGEFYDDAVFDGEAFENGAFEGETFDGDTVFNGAYADTADGFSADTADGFAYEEATGTHAD
ncbi:MAG: HlyD family efflux transporter periplasmic adaptor subunit [Clostridia bacterium]|nr:HlyD family efflux transporter periplasmic adaptor subunit [Clostridia bacterium]